MESSLIVGSTLAVAIGLGALANATAASGHRVAAAGLIIFGAAVGAGVLALFTL